MDRPKVTQLDELLKTVQRIRKTEAKILKLKEQAAAQARSFSEIPDKKLRAEAGSYAYWFAPEVPAADIAIGATGRSHPAKMLKIAGPFYTNIACGRCQQDMAAYSRTQVKALLDAALGKDYYGVGFRLLCMNCQNELQHQWLETHTTERHLEGGIGGE